MNKLNFQEIAINKVKQEITRLWLGSHDRTSIVFKSPTGSGKTFMMASVLDELVDDTEIGNNKAYIWITFSDELAMQSMKKFQQYFGKTIKNELFTAEDINTEEKLFSNSILFINWQKLTQNKLSQRKLKLRKPDEEIDQKEEGIYFDDFIDNTKKDNIDIILIIDESHKNATTQLAQEIIDYIEPKISIKVSATPKNIPNIEEIEEDKAGYIHVKHQAVVEAGLIREQILLQSKDEIQTTQEKDFDLKMLDLGMARRQKLQKQYEDLGKRINPLMLIQLPNDDARLKDSGTPTKEQVVLDFLVSKGINIDKEVGYWFDGKVKNMEDIEYLDSEISFMLFKQAAGTGWDCPRAQVLVMFREIHGSVFYIQTLGRILRMTEPTLLTDYKNTPELRKGYLYTNYHRKEVELPDGIRTLPQIKCTKPKEMFLNDIKFLTLESDYISRTDYGDFVDAAIFQNNFVKSLQNSLDIYDDGILLNDGIEQLEKYGIEINPIVTSSIITDFAIEDYDKLFEDLTVKAKENIIVELSNNDIEKLFNFLCINILHEQTSPETKVGNIARSWGPLKSALRVFFKKIAPSYSSLHWYKIFIKDLSKGSSSKFRHLISNALREYSPIKKRLLDEKNEITAKVKSPTFCLNNEWCFDETYVEIKQDNYLLENLYLKETYKGRDNELKFAIFLDKSVNVKWWYKNGDSGLENFALKYFNTYKQQYKLFYPDWFVKLQDGRIGIFDTKLGSTLSTEGRAQGLQKKLKFLGNQFWGGIVNHENEIFFYCDDENYNDESPLKNNWKVLSM